MSKAVLVFSGFNQRAVIAFLRTLEKYDVPYAIIASSEKDTIFLSSYKDKVLAVRNKIELDLEDLNDTIHQVQSKIPNTKLVIAPSTEALNRFILNHREVFEVLDCEIPLVSEQLYTKISDKKTFAELCTKNRVQVPQEFYNLSLAKIPFVAKPKTYVSSDGIVNTPQLITKEFEKYSFQEKHNPDDFFYQEYISGRSLYLLYYFYKDRGLEKFSQENFIQQPGGKSILAAESSGFHNKGESLLYEELFKSVNFTGLVMVEVKEQKGLYYMIEANPRFWGPSQLFVDAESNFFAAFLFDAGLLQEKPIFKDAQHTKYYWHGGVAEILKKQSSLAYHNYSAEKYEQEKSSWMKSDVYNRSDTKQLYAVETGE